MRRYSPAAVAVDHVDLAVAVRGELYVKATAPARLAEAFSAVSVSGTTAEAATKNATSSQRRPDPHARVSTRAIGLELPHSGWRREPSQSNQALGLSIPWLV